MEIPIIVTLSILLIYSRLQVSFWKDSAGIFINQYERLLIKYNDDRYSRRE